MDASNPSFSHPFTDMPQSSWFRHFDLIITARLHYEHKSSPIFFCRQDNTTVYVPLKVTGQWQQQEITNATYSP